MANPIDGAVDAAGAARVAIVTGAASGVGLACVALFAERGYSVLAVDRNPQGLLALKGRRGVAPLLGDTGTAATADSMVSVALQRFGRLDAVVLAAGIATAEPLASAEGLAQFEAQWRVGVHGTALGIRASVPALRASGGGSIVVASPNTGRSDDPGAWGNDATQAAVIGLVRSLAIDYVGEGIRINALAPATAREQAEGAWLLASPEASFITGAVLPVHGGFDAGTDRPDVDVRA